MLEIQQWLIHQRGNWDLLQKQLGIKLCFAEKDSRVILNYHMFDSPKTNPVCMECRALTLNKNDYGLISRAFPRFFNLGEFTQINSKFDWNNQTLCQNKEDGSLILVYWWNGEWRIQTRGSFAKGCPIDSPYTWEQLVVTSLPHKFYKRAPQDLTYVCELCTPYNQVIRKYQENNLFLLSIFDRHDEMDHGEVEEINKHLGFRRPQTHQFKNMNEVTSFIKEKEIEDSSFEGVVLRDQNNLRIKVKSKTYFAFAKLWNIVTQFPSSSKQMEKAILPHVVSNNIEEIVAYFPKVEKACWKLKKKLDKWKEEMDNLWFVYGDEPSQKKFALAVKDHKTASLLFNARKKGVDPNTLWYSENLEKLL